MKKRSAAWRAARTRRRRLKWALIDARRHPDSTYCQQVLADAQAAFRRPKK